MVEIKEVLRLWRAGAKKKRIAAQLTLDVKTVRRYVAAAESCGLAPGPERAQRRAGCRRRRGAVAGDRASARRRLAAVRGRARRDRAAARGPRAAVEGPAAPASPRRRRPVLDAAPVRGRRARLRPAWTDDPRRRRQARRGDPHRHRVDDAARARRARQATAVPRVDLHAARVAVQVRLPVLRGEHRDRDRGVRGRVGVLRRRVRRRRARLHPGDRAHRRSAQAAHHRRLPRVRAVTRLPRRSDATAASRRTRAAPSAAFATCATTASPARSCSTSTTSRRMVGTGAPTSTACAVTPRRSGLPREHFDAVEKPALKPAPTRPYERADLG